MKLFFIFVLLFVAGCSIPKADESDQPLTSKEGLAILTSDYSPDGWLMLLWPGKKMARVPVHGDSQLIVSANRPGDLIVLGRHRRDSLMVIDRFTGKIRNEHSVRKGTNAQNAVFVTSEIVYVTRYLDNSLWLGRIGSDGRLIESQEVTFPELSEGADGSSELYSIGQSGNFVLVGAQNLSDTDFKPTGHSRVTVLNVSDPWKPRVVSSVALQCQNPVTQFQFVKNGSATEVLLGGAGLMGFYSELDGCIERLSLSDAGVIGSSHRSILESSMGGDVVDFNTMDGKRAVVTVASSPDTAKALVVDLTRGTVEKEWATYAGRVPDLLPFGNGFLFGVRELENPRVELRGQNGEALSLPFLLPKDTLPPLQMESLGPMP